jgi:hypothetical protein
MRLHCMTADSLQLQFHVAVHTAVYGQKHPPMHKLRAWLSMLTHAFRAAAASRHGALP